MANTNYVSRHTGAEIDEATDKALNTKPLYMKNVLAIFKRNASLYYLTCLCADNETKTVPLSFTSQWEYLKNSKKLAVQLRRENSDYIYVYDISVRDDGIIVKGINTNGSSYINFTLNKDDVISPDPEAPEGYKELWIYNVIDTYGG